MKRFSSVATVFGVSALAIWAIFQLFAASEHQPENHIPPIALQTAQAEYMKAPGSNKVLVPVTGVEAKTVAPAPVYDASGKIVSLNPNGPGNQPVILAPVANVKIAPVYDAMGNLVSDPTGTISNVAVPVAGANMKISPVYDATGALVSDPTGILAGGNNP